MCKRGLVAEGATCLALISTCAKARQWQLSEEVLLCTISDRVSSELLRKIGAPDASGMLENDRNLLARLQQWRRAREVEGAADWSGAPSDAALQPRTAFSSAAPTAAPTRTHSRASTPVAAGMCCSTSSISLVSVTCSGITLLRLFHAGIVHWQSRAALHVVDNWTLVLTMVSVAGASEQQNDPFCSGGIEDQEGPHIPAQASISGPSAMAEAPRQAGTAPAIPNLQPSNPPPVLNVIATAEVLPPSNPSTAIPVF